MARAPQQVHARVDLLHACLPEGDTQERTVDSHVSKLRRKLEDVGVIGIPATIRGITLSITVASLCSTVLSISGFYLFYYLMEVFYPRWYDQPETIMPSGLEWLWIGLTASVVVIFATLVASRLTRRIITPLNSVAESLRRVASGDLDARARGGGTTMAEAATLVSDFNSMAERLSRMSENRVFWNAAIAHELRTPMTILRGRLQGIAEGVWMA
ncbi:hypothetical protein G6F57_018441 [Rhizopus arrhizus]|nr:hypothetical protein G6F57_018441 [Rhizopus arrhizus]